MSGGRRRTLPRGRFLPVVVAVVVLAVAGVAAAYWTGSGGGAGAVGTGTSQPVTLSPATPVAQLRPGGQASVRVTVTNPNASPVRVDSLALDTTRGTDGFAVDAGHAGCGLSSLSFTTATNGGAGWTIPGADAVTLTLSGSLEMGTTADNACQGATFTVHLQVGT
jgi:hypothetical protein